MAGFLLMSQIFSTLGAVAFFPIVLNIFVITNSFESKGILIITFLMLLGNIYLLFWDWNKMKFIVLPYPGNYLQRPDGFSEKPVWVYLGLVLLVLIIFSRVLWSEDSFKVFSHIQEVIIQNQFKNYPLTKLGWWLSQSTLFLSVWSRFINGTVWEN